MPYYMVIIDKSIGDGRQISFEADSFAAAVLRTQRLSRSYDKHASLYEFQYEFEAEREAVD